MKELSLLWNGQRVPCAQYDETDLPPILDDLFFWKTSVLLAEKTATKKPQLPEKFSERFCCLVCDLVHKSGTGPDAFRLATGGEIEAVVEIKATITEQGFTDIKRDLIFDDLYWLSFAEYNELRYKVYCFSKNQIRSYVDKSKTARDRGTVGLKRIADELGLLPFRTGRIGIIPE